MDQGKVYQTRDVELFARAIEDLADIISEQQPTLDELAKAPLLTG